MERQFREAFAGLNSRQRQAVETIDGPVLVIAGPGTGKTQLISTRVGYILQKTDTLADAILLLTFTEAGVQAMRERLNQIVGKAAYDIQLSTYHAFGGEIFRRYPDYFEGAQLSLIEELGSDNLLRNIVAKLPYSNPLKFADNYINDLKNFIGECKRALLSPDDIEEVAADNQEFIKTANKTYHKLLAKLALVSPKTVPAFEELLANLSATPSKQPASDVLPLVRYAQGELELAIGYFHESGKTTQLTEWKRHWLAKDNNGNSIMDGRRLSERLSAAAGIYRRYQKVLSQRGQYDYDDMVLRAIDTLQNNPDLKHSLAERYSYIMLDEFQDTNRAQFRLVELLTDHPVHEGRPNVLAVGDDDQAIYAFQGADHANMSSFAKHYKDVKIISLQENYRSWPGIIETGQNIASQIQSRLHKQFKGVDKKLLVTAKNLPGPAGVSVRQFKSDTAQYDWVAEEVLKMAKQGIPASEIAILAPKHRFLAPVLPYLAVRKLAVSYERRENILDEPLVHQLEQMSRLVLALADSNETLANSLWFEVLSYDFWKVPTEKIWSIGWQSRETHEPWTAILLNDEVLDPIAAFFLRLATLLPTTSLEQQLDALVGLPDISKDLRLPITSPLYDYYFSKLSSQADPIQFDELIGDLNILRSRLQEWRRNVDEPMGLRGLVEFIEGHRAANINILNSSPYHETADSVNLLTAYGAKGREFRAVFIVAATDEAWGSASRNQGYRLSLPANLSYIRYQGASEDERLRLLYVAATRARTSLYFTSYQQDLAGKITTRLKYLDIGEDEKGNLTSLVLPKRFNKVIVDKSESLSLRAATSYWTDRHLPPLRAKLKDILEPRLRAYQLSATDLNYFIDLVNNGPDAFFMKCLLHFPSAPSLTNAFGTAVHNSLRFAGRILQSEGRLPTTQRLSEIFDAQLGNIDLPSDELTNLTQRGHDSLAAWLGQSAKDLKPTDRFEYNFQGEGSSVSPARLTGKVDRIAIDEKRRVISIVDYKTGRAYQRWQPGVVKLHLFQQQLMFYKFLIESSSRFKDYRVEKGVIEFVEPDEQGRITQLEFTYDNEQLKRQSELIKAVWPLIHSLKFPDTSAYPPTLAGIRKFEDDLIGPNKNPG
ncbi:MAG: UvrD-helicase domain-containing protein [Candidatus Saccharimonadales bacterium]